MNARPVGRPQASGGTARKTPAPGPHLGQVELWGGPTPHRNITPEVEYGMSVVVMEATPARTLVDPAFFERLSLRVAQSHGLDQERAEAVTDQAIAYLATCAQKPEDAPPLFMSRAVDPAWHAFLEYTREYDTFFALHGWPKVNHNPCDGFGGKIYPPAADVLPLTVAAIEPAGFRVAPELWEEGADCGDTCGDDGGGGNPLPTCEHSN